LNVTAFREDCKGVLDDRATQQRRLSPGRQLQNFAVRHILASISLLVAVMVVVAVKVGARKRPLHGSTPKEAGPGFSTESATTITPDAATTDTELPSLGGSDLRPFRLRVDRCGCGLILALTVVALLAAFPVWTRRDALFGCHEPSHTAVGGHSDVTTLGADALANCTVDAMLERLYAADCRASITDSGGDETGYWSCGAPACADTVEQLSTECLPELNQFHHALSRPRVPVSAQKVLAALPSDLNVTAFREDCKGVLDDRAQQRARDADGPARQEKGIRVGQAAVGLSLLVAVIVGVAVKIRKRSRRTEREDSPVRSPSENSTGSSSADSGTDSDGAAVPPPVAPEQLVEHELLAQRELPFL
jgi:hypothetical protein